MDEDNLEEDNLEEDTEDTWDKEDGEEEEEDTEWHTAGLSRACRPSQPAGGRGRAKAPAAQSDRPGWLALPAGRGQRRRRRHSGHGHGVVCTRPPRSYHRAGEGGSSSTLLRGGVGLTKHGLTLGTLENLSVLQNAEPTSAASTCGLEGQLLADDERGRGRRTEQLRWSCQAVRMELPGSDRGGDGWSEGPAFRQGCGPVRNQRDDATCLIDPDGISLVRAGRPPSADNATGRTHR